VYWKFHDISREFMKKILQMEMTNDDNDTSMMNIDENVLDNLKDYVGKSDILES
jgi:hypothetical protein